MNDIKLSTADFASASKSPMSEGQRLSVAPEDAERFAAVMERHQGEEATQSSDRRQADAMQDAKPFSPLLERRSSEAFAQVKNQPLPAASPEADPLTSVKDRLPEFPYAQGESSRETSMNDKSLEPGRLPDARSAMTSETDRTASPADAKRFGSAFERSAGHHDLETGGLKKRSAPQAADAESTKSVQSLFHDFAMPEFNTTSSAASSQPTDAASPDVEALEGLVDRILVSAPDKGSPEVRLVLNNDVLKDTTISITRDLTGQLAVKITSDDAATLQTLVAGRSDLSQLLQARESQPVRIELKTEQEASADDANESDTRRRSRGLDNERGNS